MKSVFFFILLSGLSLLAGCAAPSPFVGKWGTTGLPAQMAAGGARMLILDLKSDGTFTGELKNRDLKIIDTFNGDWIQNSPVMIQFRIREPATYSIGTGMLRGENVLLCVGTQSSIQFFKFN